MKNKNFYASTALITALVLGGIFYVQQEPPRFSAVSSGTSNVKLWSYQCIDTVKYSRDTARNWKGKQDQLASLIDRQLSQIKEMGADCVALGTPYDEEFVPFLAQWVTKARDKGLKVWFRGNLSGWEGWFGYPLITNIAQHNQKITNFVTGHPELFEEGDIFTPAPEPENGGPGNPFSSTTTRATFLIFLTSSYANCQSAFERIGKQVSCGYYSVNGDIAKSILTPEVVKQTGNVVVIDHYVPSSERMDLDLRYLHDLFGAKLVLGEFGAPIPDINGNMSEAQQEEFIRQLLRVFYVHKNSITALNYWVLQGGTTALVGDDGSLKPAVEAAKDFYSPAEVSGHVMDAFGHPLADLSVGTQDGANDARTDAKGNFSFAVPANTDFILYAGGDNYQPFRKNLRLERSGHLDVLIRLNPKRPGMWYIFKRLTTM